MTGESDLEKKEKETNFQVPSWAGKPPSGFHLDVMKGDKLIQKLMIDEKRCYYFGRNPQLCDFAIDHGSCSRVHAALLYHKQLSRCFLVDLGSTHGTFIGKVRLESHQQQHLMTGQVFHFGASTRNYILREKLSAASFTRDDSRDRTTTSSQAGHLLGLPEREEELDDLTEYNTALNRRIGAMAIPEDEFGKFRKRKPITVSFDDEEQIINPEDIDPSVGRFRNLVHTAVIPKKKQRLELVGLSDFTSEVHHGGSETSGKSGLSHTSTAHPHVTGSHLSGFGPISAKLGLSLPNSAPDVELYAPAVPPVSVVGSGIVQQTHHAPMDDEPRKKKYAKEAWPGKKTITHHLLV